MLGKTDLQTGRCLTVTWHRPLTETETRKKIVESRISICDSICKTVSKNPDVQF